MTMLGAPGTAWSRNRAVLVSVLGLVLFPFVVGVLNGDSLGAVLNNESGDAVFLQGLAIEVFILAIYALSYDLLLGVSGVLSFGHAMFFAVGAYGTGIALKTFEMGMGGVIIAVLVLAIIQAVMFAIPLTRVGGITYALVTLGFAVIFQIIILSSELSEWTGSDVGLQGINPPAWLDTNTQRLRFYFIAGSALLTIFLVYRRIADSPTGRVLVANRENEDRALMLGYNTYWFKFVALIVSSITAALAGTLHALHAPIVSSNVAGLFWTVAVLLMILIGGMGTLTGAIVGAAVFRLLQFYLDRWFGASAGIVLGLVFIAIVLYLPYGIVGTWRLKTFERSRGWARLKGLFDGSG